MDRIVNSNVNEVRLSRLSVAEMISAFAIKARTKSIDHEDARALVRRFRGDLARGKFEVFEIENRRLPWPNRSWSGMPSKCNFALWMRYNLP